MTNVVNIKSFIGSVIDDDSPETGGPQDPPEWEIPCGECDSTEFNIATSGDVICAGCGIYFDDMRVMFLEDVED